MSRGSLWSLAVMIKRAMELNQCLDGGRCVDVQSQHIDTHSLPNKYQTKADDIRPPNARRLTV